MNRIIKYQESISKFIKTKSHVNTFDDLFKNWIIEEIKNTDYTFSIILLTTMNNQNKKNKISLHGYYIASAMEFLNVLCRMIISPHEYIKKLNARYSVYMSNIILLLNVSLTQNLESIETQTNLSKEKIVIISRLSHKYLNDKLTKLVNVSSMMTNKKDYVKTDIGKFHFKNEILKNHLQKIRQIEGTELLSYIDKTYGIVAEVAFGLGWILGCGEIKTIQKIEQISTLFGILIKLTVDFDNLEKDLTDNIKDISVPCEHDIVTMNYILNNSFQTSIELFLDTKQKFIESALKYDIFTNTLKDITDNLEDKLDCIIEETSPDLLSNASEKVQ